MLTHRNLTAAMLESVIEYEPQPDERNLVAFPLCHVAGYAVRVTHMRGGRIVLTPMFEPELWMQLVDEHGITGTAMAPTMLNMVLQHPKIDEYTLDSLRSIGYGAAAMPVEVLRAAIERFGPIVYSGLRHDRARRQRADVPEVGPRAGRQRRGAPARRRAARRCASPTSRSSTRRWTSARRASSARSSSAASRC